VVTLHIYTFPVRTVINKSNINTGNAQANIDVSLAKTHCNAGVHKSVERGRHIELILSFKAYCLRDEQAV
jgi:hypothetical protein